MPVLLADPITNLAAAINNMADYFKEEHRYDLPLGLPRESIVSGNGTSSIING